MNAINHSRPLSVSRFLYQAARFTAAILFAVWAVLVVAELFANHFEYPAPNTVLQGMTLAAVFFGYYYSLRHPVGGSYITLAGVAMFFVIAKVTTGVWPPAAAAWLVLPAVLALSATSYRKHIRQKGQLVK
jgi:hypothetical protein